MIHRNETAISVPIEFPSGFPDGNIVWTLKDEVGTLVDDGTFAPTPNSVSTSILIPSASNTLGVNVLTGYRDLEWTFEVDGVVINGEHRYILEARTPWGSTPSGVRRKLGVEPHELPDHDISLVGAYYDLLAMMGNPDLSVYVPTPRDRLKLGNAVEAVAALTALPTLQIRIANKESSGTDTFQRQAADWELLASGLQGIIADAILIVVPTFDPTFGFGAILILASPAADPLTGAEI